MKRKQLVFFALALLNVLFLIVCRTLFQWEPIAGGIGFLVWIAILFFLPYDKLKG